MLVILFVLLAVYEFLPLSIGELSGLFTVAFIVVGFATIAAIVKAHKLRCDQLRAQILSLEPMVAVVESIRDSGEIRGTSLRVHLHLRRAEPQVQAYRSIPRSPDVEIGSCSVNVPLMNMRYMSRGAKLVVRYDPQSEHILVDWDATTALHEEEA